MYWGKKTLPVGHLSQLELPDAAEYCPAAQVSHDVLPGQIVGDVNQGQIFFSKGRKKTNNSEIKLAPLPGQRAKHNQAAYARRGNTPTHPLTKQRRRRCKRCRRTSPSWRCTGPQRNSCTCWTRTSKSRCRWSRPCSLWRPRCRTSRLGTTCNWTRSTTLRTSRRGSPSTPWPP